MCDKSFTQAGILKVHMMSHSGEKPHSCQVCHKSFRQTNNLKAHRVLHSRREDTLPLCHLRVPARRGPGAGRQRRQGQQGGQDHPLAPPAGHPEWWGARKAADRHHNLPARRAAQHQQYFSTAGQAITRQIEVFQSKPKMFLTPLSVSYNMEPIEAQYCKYLWWNRPQRGYWALYDIASVWPPKVGQIIIRPTMPRGCRSL